MRAQRFAKNSTALGFFPLFLLVLVLEAQGYWPTESGMLIVIPLAIAVGFLAYISIVFSKKPMVIFISSLIVPVTVLSVVLQTNFAPIADILGVLVLLGLLYPIFVRLRPWPLILTALIPPVLASGLIAFSLLVAAFPLLGPGSDKELYRLNSPDKSWPARARETDNVLDGNFHLYVSQKYLFGLIKHERQIYLGHFGERPGVRWLDNETLSIDNHTLEVATDPELDLSNRAYNTGANP